MPKIDLTNVDTDALREGRTSTEAASNPYQGVTASGFLLGLLCPLLPAVQAVTADENKAASWELGRALREEKK